MGFVKALFEEHKFIRRFGMVMCFGINMAIATTTIYCLLHNIKMEDNIQLTFSVLLGLNSLYIGAYQWDAARRP